MIGWSYSSEVSINNSYGSSLIDYPIRIDLDASNFEFDKALADGSDIRVTDDDRTTIIPYHILSYNSTSRTATIWVKVPVIPSTSLKTIYLFYGNPSPNSFYIPPVGPYVKYSTNPVITSTVVSQGILAENIVYDNATGKYWMLFEDRRFALATDWCIGLAYSTDLVTWTEYESNPIYQPPVGYGSNAPHLLKSGSTWYLYFGSQIYLATAPDITGPYTLYSPTPIVPAGTGWEASRATEPYVFQVGSMWYMFYMGDTGANLERVGYATSLTPEGPWTKYAGNPVLGLGETNSYDGYIVADPSVYELDGTYYIYYSCVPNQSAVGIIAYATTRDFINYTKHNIILGEGSQFGWDDNASFRGAVSLFGDYYYLSFTGFRQYGVGATMGSSIGIAKQYAKNTTKGYPIEQVLTSYDDFTETSLSNQWRTETDINATGGTTSINSGILTLNSGAKQASRPFLKLLSIQELRVNSIVEAYVKAPDYDASTDHGAAIGLGGAYNRPFDMVNSAFWTTGKFGGCGDFVYKKNYINFGNDASLKIATNLTVEAWINVTRYSHQSVNYFLSKYPNWGFFISNTGTLVVLYGASTAITAANAFSASDLDKWVHVAFAYDGSTTKIFKDGVELSTTGTFTGSIDTTSNLYAGFRSDVWFFDGLIDEIRISDNVRYTGSFTVPNAPFVTDANTSGLWHFDDGSGLTVADSSTNSNDGTVSAFYGINIHVFNNTNWIMSASDGVGNESAMIIAADAFDYHTLRVWLKSGEAKYKVDNGIWETLSSNIPSGTFPVYVVTEAEDDNTKNTNLLVDWIMARPYVEPEPTVIIQNIKIKIRKKRPYRRILNPYATTIAECYQLIGSQEET